MKLKSFLQAFGIFAVLLTLIPLFAADFWWIRVFDYPHIQLTILTLTALASYFIRFEMRSWRDYTFVLVLLACFIFQFTKIYPYTPLSSLEAGKPGKNADIKDSFVILTSNVLQKNKKADLVINEIKKINPDLAVFTETNTRWQKDLQEGIGQMYPYKISAPLDNTYGMILYSKLKLENPHTSYIVDDSIPSMHAVVQLASGKKFQLHAIHPTPPMPQENPSSTDRDAELMKVALETLDAKMPVVVIGDFNDVAWSQSSHLFKKLGGLLDVRVGRNFYTTFDVNSIIMRWPLDQIFVTEEFRVADISKGSDVGSDHFPFYAKLYLQPELAKEQIPKKATKEEIKTARKEIRKEIRHDGHQ
ncbi:endonuclease/exonuclease/phosphatase family protein [Christiangramia fulva]|uniref:Endonuclease/exonuclease/phosphatase family protein n=1 Tax=Christiangramia fulva TaxID=2126553 RepID=A0A2R3Z7Q7_9FLAO|nr:endonuclease/exonuclease/phosphatase family protein [Christiangramia fulva]AVR46301.1 endonuclease/exonuclease/phosphatase family protein [Christiangramia fulva]